MAGSYFSFLQRGMLKPYAEVREDWWHVHFISLDYGYGKSSAAAGLYVRGEAEDGYPEGRIRKIGELAVPHKPVYEFAQMVVDQFVTPTMNGERRKIVAVYLDPANFATQGKQYGDGHSIADQINEVLAPHDLSCSPASNDRIGGWQLLYRLMKTGEFEMCDNCPDTFDSLRTRIHDEKKPGDILKVAGDKGDDISDETRYAIYTFFHAAEKPLAVRMAEVMRQAPDPTNAMITRLKMQAEVAKETGSIYTGMNATRRAKFDQARRPKRPTF